MLNPVGTPVMVLYAKLYEIVGLRFSAVATVLTASHVAANVDIFVQKFAANAYALRFVLLNCAWYVKRFCEKIEMPKQE